MEDRVDKKEKKEKKIAKERKVIPDPIDDRKFHEWKESGKSGIQAPEKYKPEHYRITTSYFNENKEIVYNLLLNPRVRKE